MSFASLAAKPNVLPACTAGLMVAAACVVSPLAVLVVLAAVVWGYLSARYAGPQWKASRWNFITTFVSFLLVSICFQNLDYRMGDIKVIMVAVWGSRMAWELNEKGRIYLIAFLFLTLLSRDFPHQGPAITKPAPATLGAHHAS